MLIISSWRNLLKDDLIRSFAIPTFIASFTLSWAKFCRYREPKIWMINFKLHETPSIRDDIVGGRDIQLLQSED